MFKKHKVKLIDDVTIGVTTISYYQCMDCVKIFCWFKPHRPPKGHPAGKYDIV